MSIYRIPYDEAFRQMLPPRLQRIDDASYGGTPRVPIRTLHAVGRLCNLDAVTVGSYRAELWRRFLVYAYGQEAYRTPPALLTPLVEQLVYHQLQQESVILNEHTESIGLCMSPDWKQWQFKGRVANTDTTFFVVRHGWFEVVDGDQYFVCSVKDLGQYV